MRGLTEWESERPEKVRLKCIIWTDSIWPVEMRLDK